MGGLLSTALTHPSGRKWNKLQNARRTGSRRGRSHRSLHSSPECTHLAAKSFSLPRQQPATVPWQMKTSHTHTQNPNLLANKIQAVNTLKNIHIQPSFPKKLCTQCDMPSRGLFQWTNPTAEASTSISQFGLQVYNQTPNSLWATV